MKIVNKSYLTIGLFVLGILTSCKIEEEEFVPEWAKDAIWYQVFPERFRNGDLNNDPTQESIQGTDPIEPPKKWQIHPWGSDWYKLQDYEKDNGDHELWKHLLRRRYGGDLQGLIQKLDYLKDLGVNAIYINPIFDSPSMHKYDSKCYHHVDPHFGPDPVGDKILMELENPSNPETWVWTKADELALTLIKEVHKRKMKIIFDGVFNHMGIQSFAFKDVEVNQEKSIYKDWFIINSWQDSINDTKFKYKGWFNVPTLPEIKEDSNGIVSGPKEYIFNATSRWMNPKNQGIENGIDGWRLDVAFCIHHRFWKDWRKHVKSINKNAFLTAELVLNETQAVPYLNGDEFDGEMNYNFAFTCSEFFFSPDTNKISVSEFDRKLKTLRTLYPKGVAEVSQNLFNSHDANRIASHIVNRGIGNYRNWWEYYATSKAAENKNYEVRKPTSEEIKIQKLFLAFQMTYVGAPMIYYGDEVGMWGANDPDCRKPMIWNDIDYENETYKPDGSRRMQDSVIQNMELLKFYKQIIGIRNKEIALRRGNFSTIMINNLSKVYGFERQYENERILIFINNGYTETTIALPNSITCVINLLENDKIEFTQNVLSINLLNRNVNINNRIINLPSHSFIILKECR